MLAIIKVIIKNILPYGIIERKNKRYEYSYLQNYLDYKKINTSLEFDTKANYKSIIVVQGFGYSGSGAIVDLLREYSNCSVFGYVDQEGSLSCQQMAAGEMDFMRHSGGIFEIEKQIGDNNVFINDALLHRYLKLVETTEICKASKTIKHLFYNLFDKITENNDWNLSKRFYNPHLLPAGKSEIFFLRQIEKNDYFILIRSFLTTLFNILNNTKKEVIVLDQFFSDMNFDLSHYCSYIDNLRYIVVYRDPRDVYTFAVIKNVEWIPHNSVKQFVNWCKIMYRRFNVQNTQYLSIRFEDLITKYDETINIIELFTGLSNTNHIAIKKHFNPQVSAGNMTIWKKYVGTYRADYDIILDKLRPYCYVD